MSRLDLESRQIALDVCTGPGGVAASVNERYGCPVVGLDLSTEMLARARNRLNNAATLVQGRAESLPFSNNSFDSVIFTFLLRYVENVEDTIVEMARVLRSGGVLASLEFFTPSGLLYPPWLFHTRVVLPIGTALISPGWRKVGTFLGPSISGFYKKNSLHDIEQAWQNAGIEQIRITRLSLGGAVVMQGRKRK